MNKFLKRIFLHPNDLSEPMTGIEMTGGIAGNLVMTLLFVMTSSFMAYYYTDVVGIGAAAVGTIMLLARLINAVTDIGSGVVISRTKSKHGKARPWIMRVMLPLALSVVAVFSVPDSLNIYGKTIYAAVTYIFMIAVCFSLVQMAGAIIGPSQTSNSKSRQTNAVVGSIFTMLAAVVGAAFTQQFTAARGDNGAAWQLVAIIFSVLALVGLAVQFAFTRERKSSVSASEAEDRIPFKTGLKALMKNKYWFIMFLVGILTNIDAALSGASMYYFKVVLQNPSLISIVSLASLVPTLAGFGLLPLLTKKFSQRSLMLFGLAVKIVTFSVNAIVPTNQALFVGFSMLRAFTNAPLLAFAGVFLMNTIEYGEWKTGLRTASINVSVSSFGGKIGAGLGSGLVGWLLAFGGYVSNAAVQPDSVPPVVVMICCVLPAIIAGLIFSMLWFYDLEKHYGKIVETLRERRLVKAEATT